MATANNIVSITELDFDQIKRNLITFLQGQSTFSDYNFEGSGLSVLLDILAYNTHYGAYYLNMLANEMHISTAQLRDNIVQMAKALNYVPGSASAATAVVNITVTPDDPTSASATLLLPRFSSFISQAINGINYNFVTTQAYTASFDGVKYTFNDVQLREGDVINYTYPVVGTGRISFNIPNANIDTSTLLVNVTETDGTQPTTYPYVYAQDVSLLDGNSRVYFLEGSRNQTYNVYFGDSILGKKPSNGDSVNLVYLNTHGDGANYVSKFSIANPIGGYTNVLVQTTYAASGGTVAESASDIKFHAPLAYSTQNRAVTLADYKFLLKRDYQNINSLAVWGGDQNNPPSYGRVFISIKPKFGNYLSTLQKQTVLDIIQQYTMPTVEPIIVDPDYTYLIFKLSVNYNPKLTTATQDQFSTSIRNTVINFANSQLNAFDATYRESSLIQTIMASDPSILGVQVATMLQKRFFPILNQSATYTLNFNTGIYVGGLTEKLYSSPGIYMYDSSGTLRTCFLEEAVNTSQGISSINVLNPGTNYYDIPTVTIAGDGVGASAHAVIVNGSVNSIVIDNPGEGYSFATASITGGGGFGAAIMPVLSSTSGIIKTYYVDSSNKFYVSTNQGSVDHSAGIVTLNNFSPVDIANQTKMVAVNITPDKNFITPARNNVLILDPTDTSSIQISLLPQLT